MSNEQKHWWLYILRCEGGKYYVGITSKTPEERLKEHQQKKRAAYWTMKYAPTEIIYQEDLGFISKEGAEKRENKMVRACLKKYGVNNVRGGDLKDTSDYILRFGYICDKESYKDAVWTITIMVVLFVFYIDKYLYPFLPGGVR